MLELLFNVVYMIGELLTESSKHQTNKLQKEQYSDWSDLEPTYDDFDCDYDCDNSDYRGYCSHHDGIDDISDSGTVYCNDGSISPSS
jgi:hypothetical protein